MFRLKLLFFYHVYKYRGVSYRSAFMPARLIDAKGDKVGTLTSGLPNVPEKPLATSWRCIRGGEGRGGGWSLIFRPACLSRAVGVPTKTR